MVAGGNNSLRIINKNNMPVVQESIEVCLAQVGSRDEVIVVDSNSTDGAKEYLQELSKPESITLIESECSRGRGRKIALEQSRRSYIICDIETNDILIPRLIPNAVSFYHDANFEGKLMLMNGFSIAPWQVYQSVGGWKDLQWDEQSYIWYLVSTHGLLTYVPFETRAKITVRRRSALGQPRWRYVRARERLRIGASPVQGVRRSRYPAASIAAAAWVRSGFMERYSPKLDPQFQLTNYAVKDIFPPIQQGEGSVVI
jgi:glycosyltransferase involved in cell wall biosynthesis